MTWARFEGFGGEDEDGGGFARGFAFGIEDLPGSGGAGGVGGDGVGGVDVGGEGG